MINKLKIIFTSFVIIISGCVAPSKISDTKIEKKPAPKYFQKENWIESTLNSMTLEEKVSQLLFVWTLSPYFSKDAVEWIKAEQLAKENKIGGFIFSIGDVYEYAIHINKLQKISKVPLLISGDYEWGLAMRIRGTTNFPRAMALGASRDTSLAFEMGKAIAREARAIGIHQNYAPVVDVNNNPLNPVINTRSFGEDKKLVSEMAIAFANGLQNGGVIATAKHFPGHGDTEIDTHLDMPTLKFSRERFDSLELVPFKKIIDAGIQSIMVGHISVPSLDSTSDLPSTVSKLITTKLLQNEMGFKGLIVTDAMVMKGLTKKLETGEASIRAIEAGNDILLMVPDEIVVTNAIAEAVKNGRLTEERINHSVRKILSFKQKVGLDKNRFVDLNEISSNVAIQEHLDLAKEISRKGIVVLGNQKKLLPLSSNGFKNIVEVIVTDEVSATIGNVFHSELQQRMQNVQVVKIHPESNQIDFDKAISKISSADLIFLQLHFYTRTEQMTGFLRAENISFLKNIIESNKPLIAVSFGNPYIAMNLPPVENYICTFSGSDFSQKSSVAIIFGEESPVGKLPITIPNYYNFGDGVNFNRQVVREGKAREVGASEIKFQKIDSIINKAIGESIFPGASVLIAKDGIIIKNKGFGKLTYDENSTNVTPQTIYDLASVTKVISTTTAVMKLVDENKIKLEDKVAKYIPQFSQNGKNEITIYNLLVHNSGLPGWRKFYEFCETPKCVLDSIYSTPLIYKTGDSTIYSDLGLITVGKIIEKISGTSLNKFVDSLFFKPLGMKNTMYNPPIELLNNIAPTEIDTHWQKTNLPVHGRVHDENAATLGGVSGHAGLFSTTEDLAKILYMLQNGGVYNGKKYLSSEVISRFTKRQSEKSSRAIGWDTKSPIKSSAGKYFSTDSFTHTGFTGTMVLVDPKENTIVIFLTNRVYPNRANTRISEIRPKVHDYIFEALH